MSQAGIVDIEGSHPQIPTAFVTDMGTAIPIANVLEILGTTVAAHGIPLETTGSGNTVTVVAQYASAAASSVATNAGFASFNSAQFTTDANGYVSFTGAVGAETLTGNSGGIVGPTGGNINTVGDGSITIVGNPGTSTLTTQLTGLTNHSLLVGAGTPTITNLGVATNGQLPIGSTGADPVLANITSTGGTITITNGPGTINLETAGGGGGITTIDGDTGSITGSTVTIFANVASLNCGSTVQFTNSGTTSTFNVSDANSNTIIGGASGNATVSGFANIGVGSGIFDSLAGGNFNSAFGPNCLSTVSSGSSNTACGSGALTSLGTGSFNLALGAGAGGSYSSSESNNICIGTNGGSTAGTPGDSGVIRIGDIGVNTTCFISGINNSDSSGFTSPLAVFVDSSTGQLGFGSGGGGGGITTINGDSGSITGSTVKIFANVAAQKCGSTVEFVNSGTTSTLNVSDANANTLIGLQTGNATLSGSVNTGFGRGVLSSLTSGSSNSCFGDATGPQINSGNFNTAIGKSALTSLQSGSNNVAIGYQALNMALGSTNTICGSLGFTSLTASGDDNIGLGYLCGSSYTSSESSNIVIGSVGITGESNAIHIGTQGSGAAQQNVCFIAGIFNNDSSGFTSPLPVFIDSSTGQLGFGVAGVSSITGDTGSPISGAALTIYANNASINCGSSVQFNNDGATTSTLNVTDASNNTLIGLNAGNLTLSGSNNTSLGVGTGVHLTSGASNVMVGFSAGNFIQDGSFNICIGDSAAAGLGSGSSNISIGHNAGGNGSVNGNIIIGDSAGGSSSGDNNICIGGPGNLITPGASIQIGNNATHTSCAIQGIDGVTVTGSAVLINSSGQLGDVVSSQRFKKDIHDLPSNDILKLRPVAFKYIKQTDEHQHFGLIAEEVEKIFPELVLYDKENRPYSVMYHEMPALLLAEIQKLHKKIAELELKMSA